MTGPPAAGKTTLVKRLRSKFPRLKTFIYSELLTEYLERTERKELSQDDLRKSSAKIITPEIISAVDHSLIKNVSTTRRSHHVLIDSHPMTKEDFGFRVTAFGVPFLRKLKPDRICMLFTSPETVMERIKRKSEGRPTIDEFEANFHCFGQESIAICYGIQLGVPVYFYDSSQSIDGAFSELSKRFAA